jgi:cation-transporting ATPase 13A1
MCGDGTNDVGALKQANVGIGLVETPHEAEEEKGLEAEYKPKLGAASIASPFVSKRPTITACIDIIRFGRATLSSTIDLFKQQSLNCLIAGYVYSVLFLENIHFGDRQLTVFSVVLMIAGMSTSWAVPSRTLSRERPFSGQFNRYLVTSVLLQFGLHLVFLYLTHSLVFSCGVKPDRFNLRSRFEPSLLNTALFILKGEMELMTILCNYRGKPFMQSFSENRMLMVGTILSCLIIGVLLLDIHPLIAKLFQLVSFPSRRFQLTLGFYCVADAVLSMTIERLCLFYFSQENRRAAEGFVEQQVINELEDYLTNDDDVLPESSYNFGLTELMNQSMVNQAQIKARGAEREKQEKQKQELAKKAQQDAQDYLDKRKR